MAFLSTSDFTLPRKSAVKSVFAAIGAFFTRMIEAQSRQDQVDRLNEMTDVELAAFGVRREDIIRFVFRDCYHL